MAGYDNFFVKKLKDDWIKVKNFITKTNVYFKPQDIIMIDEVEDNKIHITLKGNDFEYVVVNISAEKFFKEVLQ